jgi:hypothetical protein
MCKYYYLELQLGKARKVFRGEETLFSTGLLVPLVFELLFLAVHSPPFLDSTFDIHIAHLNETYEYSWDAMLSIFVVGRCYLFLRAVHYVAGFETAHDARVLATLNDVDVGISFTFKHMMHTRPFTFISTFFLATSLVLTYALRISESPQQVRG